MLQSDDEWSEVVSVRIAPEPLKAYNLTVDRYHTYFVRGFGDEGGDPVWVHNNCYNWRKGTFDNPPSHMRPNEIETGRRLQADLKRELRPLDDQSNGDFVDIHDKIYDAMGQPGAYSNWGDGKDFLGSINDHFNRTVDHVVIDLTGSTLAQKNQILEHVARHPNASKRNAVIFVGL